LLEFALKEFGSGRVIERQRRQGIEHAVVAGSVAVRGFDAEDRDQILRRNACLQARLVQLRAVREPEVGTFLNAFFIDEYGLVVIPGLGLLSRLVHRFDDRRLSLSYAQQLAQPAPVEGVLLRHRVDELSDVRPAYIQRSGLGADAKERNNRAQGYGQSPAAP
jgi:hypothetical protein